MNPSLFKAILAMDAYNRGNAPGLLNLGGSQLGSATILNIALPTGAAAAGFSATAYQLADGSKVISYRGTDNFSFSADPDQGAGALQTVLQGPFKDRDVKVASVDAQGAPRVEMLRELAARVEAGAAK